MDEVTQGNHGAHPRARPRWAVYAAGGIVCGSGLITGARAGSGAVWTVANEPTGSFCCIGPSARRRRRSAERLSSAIWMSGPSGWRGCRSHRSRH